MNTALFLLRATELGLSMADLDCLTIGLVLDMSTEKANDDYDWKTLATQEDMNRFAGINPERLEKMKQSKKENKKDNENDLKKEDKING